MLVVSPGCSRHPAGSTKTHSRRRLRRAAAAGNCAARCWGWCGFPSDLRAVATGRPTRSRVPRAPRNGAGRRRGFYGAAHGGLSPPAAPETVLQGSQRTRGGEIATTHDTSGRPSVRILLGISVLLRNISLSLLQACFCFVPCVFKEEVQNYWFIHNNCGTHCNTDIFQLLLLLLLQVQALECQT